MNLSLAFPNPVKREGLLSILIITQIFFYQCELFNIVLFSYLRVRKTMRNIMSIYLSKRLFDFGHLCAI